MSPYALGQNPQGSANGGFQTVVLVGPEIEFPYPLLTSIQPPFYLNFTSMLPLFNLFFPLFKIQLSLCFVRNLEPQFGNHGLQTFGKWYYIWRKSPQRPTRS